MIVTIRKIVTQTNKDTMTATAIPTPLSPPLEAPESAAGSIGATFKYRKSRNT